MRVALEQLEVAGALRRKPDGVLGYMDAEVQPLSDARLNEVVAQVSARHAHKRKLLDLMIGYAESGDCRRRLLLNYFGDPSAADAPICCDNCLARAEARAETQTAQTQSERAALIVLDTIQHMQWEIGAQKLAHILKGSKAKDVRSYAKARNFGKFSALSLQEIDDLLKQLISAGYAKQVGGDRPVLRLTPRGVEALKARSAIQVNLRPVRSGEIRKRIALQEAGGTVALTGQLLAQGKTPEQIAAERGLTVGTIFSHLAQLIAQGTVNVNQVVPADLQAQIRKAIEAVGSTEYLTPIKMRLPDVIEYSVIRCVVEAWKREHGMVAEQTASGQSRAERVHALGESGSLEHVEELIAALKDSNGNVRRLAASALGKLGARDAVEPLLDLVANDNYPQVKQYAIKALGRIGDMRAIPVLERIAGDKDERDYNRTAAITALRNLGVKASNYADHLIPGVQTAAHPNSSQISQLTNQQTNQFSIDPIADFLSRPHPRPLKGPWLAGWALDFHSRFDGDVNRRGAIGDLVFRYKYQEESALASELAAHWARLLAAHPELPKPDAIISIPPSAPRPFDPVSKLAEALAELLHIPAMTSALAKTRVTKPQKEMTSLAQKQVNVAGAFTLKESVRGKRVIVVDDLYDSGATLEEAARVLSRGGAAGIVVLTLTKTIHADA